jgi:hypothetical protein
LKRLSATVISIITVSTALLCSSIVAAEPASNVTAAADTSAPADIVGFGDYHFGAKPEDFDFKDWEKTSVLPGCPVAYVGQGKLTLTGPTHEVRYVLGFQEGKLAAVMISMPDLWQEVEDLDAAELLAKDLRAMLLGKYEGSKIEKDAEWDSGYQGDLTLQDSDGDRVTLDWTGWEITLLYVTDSYVKRAKAQEAQDKQRDKDLL